MLQQVTGRIRNLLHPQQGKKAEMPRIPPAELKDRLVFEVLSQELPTHLPFPPDDRTNVLERYWVNVPYAHIRLVNDPEEGLQYEVVEPELTPRELILLEEVHAYFRDVLIFDVPVRKGGLKLEFPEFEEIAKKFEANLPRERLSVLFYYLKRNFFGYGRLDPLLHDPHLEDISCNGPGIPVFVYHRAYGSLPTDVLFGDEEMTKFVLKLAQKADKQISLSTPLVDAHLPDGSRIQLTFSDVVSTRGSSFTIRRFKTEPMTPTNLIDYNTFDAAMLAFLWLAIENRTSMIVCGGTASGKTSTMNALSFFIPLNAKIVSLEDTREIQLPHRNWLPTQTRDVNIASVKGEIDMFSLLKATLRQRPEYIVVGEVRGREAQTLFQAMNTGHTTFSTLHAGNIDEAINRLTNEPISVPPVMFSALDLIVVQSIHFREGKILRRCDAIHEILVERDGKIRFHPIFQWDSREDIFKYTTLNSRVFGRIARDHGWSDEEMRMNLERRKDYLEGLSTRHLRDSHWMLRAIQEFNTRDHDIPAQETEDILNALKRGVQIDDAGGIDQHVDA